MQKEKTDKNLLNKLKMIATLIFNEIWGLLLMITSIYLIHVFLRSDRQITGFITGVTFGIIVWFILTKKHWLYPLCYSIIMFAYLVTKRAVDVGIAGFYLNEWYGSIELMTLYATIATIILYKLTEWIQKRRRAFLMFKILCIILSVGILFFSGVYGESVREKQRLFSTACNMMIEQLFIMRNEINNLIAGEHLDMQLAEAKLDFNLASTTVLVESFLPEKSKAKKFDEYISNQVRNFIFNYDEGVEKGAYKAGLSDKDRMIILRDFCSKLATDINATYGELDKVDQVLSEIRYSFSSLVK